MNIKIYLFFLKLSMFSLLDISIISNNKYNSIFDNNTKEISSSYLLSNFLTDNKKFFLTNINLYLNIYPPDIDYFLLSIKKNISDVSILSLYSSNQMSDLYYFQEKDEKNTFLYKFIFTCEEYVVKAIKQSHQYNIDMELILNSENHKIIIKSIRKNKSLNIYSVELSINHFSYFFSIGKNCNTNYSKDYFLEISLYSILFLISILLSVLIDDSNWRIEFYFKSINLNKALLDKVVFYLIFIIVLIKTVFFIIYKNENFPTCKYLSLILFSIISFYLTFSLFCNIFLISISKIMTNHEDDIKLPFTQYIYLQTCKLRLKIKNSYIKKIIFTISVIISILVSVFLLISTENNLFLTSDLNSSHYKGVLYGSILNICQFFNFISFILFILSFIRLKNIVQIFILSFVYMTYEILFFFIVYFQEVTSYNKSKTSTFIDVYNFINYLIPNFLSLQIQSLSDLSSSSYNFSFYKSIFIASLLKTGIRFDRLKQNKCFYLIINQISICIGIVINAIISEYFRFEVDCFLTTFVSLFVMQILIICALSRGELYDLYKGRNINNMLYNLKNKYLSIENISPETTNSHKTTSPNSNSNQRKIRKTTILEMNILKEEIKEVPGEYENDNSLENNIDSTKRLKRSMTEVKMTINESNKKQIYESSKNLKVMLQLK